MWVSLQSVGDENHTGVCPVWEAGALVRQAGAQQAGVDRKRGLSRISKLILWMALSSLLLFICIIKDAMISLLSQEWGGGNVCKLRHRSKLLEACLGMREHFFIKKKAKWQCQILFLMGKNLYEERLFHSVEGMIWKFITFSSFLSKTCFSGFVLLPFVGFF